MEKRSFIIPEYRLPQVQETLSSVNRKAAKMGLPNECFATMEVGEPYIHDLEMPDKEIVHVSVVQIHVYSQILKLGDYALIGVIDHNSIPGHIILNSVPGQFIPHSYHHASQQCDHCGHNRRRVETFVIQNQNDGQYMQVGRTCMKEFLGIDPNDMLKHLSRLWEFCDELAESSKISYDRFPVEHFQYDTNVVLAVSIAIIAKLGFVSKQVAYDTGKTATASHVSYYLSARQDDNWLAFKREIALNDEHFVQANKVIDWGHMQQPSNDYMVNLITICNSKSLPQKEFGKAASIPAAYYRANQQTKPHNERAVSQYVGSEGSKLTTQVTIIGKQVITSDYGQSMMLRMQDNSGNILIWFASGSTHGMEENGQYEIIATVKKHENYRGTCQTRLTHVKLVRGLLQAA